MDDQTDTVKPLIGIVAAEDVARFDRVEPEAHFSIPAHPTVKQQLEYYSRLSETIGEPIHLRMWACAQALIRDWECEVLPNPKANLDSITDPNAAMVIMWCGNAVLNHMNNLEALPKV